ncbi:MAG TPA: transglutaminase-like domain-containing protein [Cryomorphaceae bacterium]|nr:transglutaminase-like domain-containing protein [Cryomorphaceae bacterium]
MKQLGITLAFFLLLNVFSSAQKVSQLSFDTESIDTTLCDFVFPNPQTDADLKELNQKYDLNKLIDQGETQLDKAMILLNWTANRWKHNGSNRPKKNDALSILAEVDEGKSFRCVEYGIVLAATLNSIGIPARTLELKTRDVETTKYDAGHVVSEAYLSQFNKWVFMDGQVNYIPFMNGIPLNAVEYQNAVVNHRGQLELRSITGTLSKRQANKQIKWVSKYLFYFDTVFDSSKSREECRGKRKLMLVPLDAKNPTIFQIEYKIDNCIYTNRLKDFYREPKII